MRNRGFVYDVTPIFNKIVLLERIDIKGTLKVHHFWGTNTYATPLGVKRVESKGTLPFHSACVAKKPKGDPENALFLGNKKGKNLCR